MLGNGRGAEIGGDDGPVLDAAFHLQARERDVVVLGLTVAGEVEEVERAGRAEQLADGLLLRIDALGAEACLEVGRLRLRFGQHVVGMRVVGDHEAGAAGTEPERLGRPPLDVRWEPVVEPADKAELREKEGLVGEPRRVGASRWTSSHGMNGSVERT